MDRRLLGFLQRAYDYFGSDRMPMVVFTHSETKSDLMGCYRNSRQVSSDAKEYDRIETDFGTIKLTVDDAIPYGEFRFN